MRIRLLQYINNYWRHEQGAVAIMFAIMLPLLILFYSVAFDGASIQSERSRLADAVNQGVLAVAMTDNRNLTPEGKSENINLLHNYIAYYLQDADISDNDLTITLRSNYDPHVAGKLKSVDYSASGKVSLHPIITGRRINMDVASPYPGFSDSTVVSASDSAGTIRRSTEDSVMATDYALVLNFSGTMTLASDEPGLTRLQLLKKVVQSFIDTTLSSSETPNKISLVPYGMGTPVILPGTNPFGGNNFGCSFVGKLLPEYADVDLNFWYNKKRARLAAYDPAKYPYMADDNLAFFYHNYISADWGELVDKGICVKNDPYGPAQGKAEYSCDADPEARISTHREKFIKQLPAAMKLMKVNYDTYSTVSKRSMDIDGLLAGDYMFRDENVITYNYNIVGNQYRAFENDCLMAFGDISNDAFENSPRLPTAEIREKVKRYLTDKSIKPDSYLIDLTDNKSALEEINNMTISNQSENFTVGSWSEVGLISPDSVNALGLLRAVPILAKGQNPRKVIIMISDSLEGDTMVHYHENVLGHGSRGKPYGNEPGLAEELFNHGLCEKIKSGLKMYSAGNTEDADIFFIFTVNDEEGQPLMKLWSDKCVGKENIFLSTNYEQLIATLNKIMHKSKIEYVNKNE